MTESTGSRLTSDDEFWDTKPTDCQISDNNLGGVSVWCDGDNLFRFIQHARGGDRLELVNKKLLPHLHSWAIYKSFSKWNPFYWSAVQFFNHANEEWGAYSKRNTFLNVSLPASKDVICVSSISHYFNKLGGKVRINNLKDRDWSPISKRKISKEVTYQLEELHENDAGVKVYVCRNQFQGGEDFVNCCRYGTRSQRKNHRRVREWHSKANIEEFIREVRIGDRLEFTCSSTYECWGIYIGQRGDDLEQVVLFAKGDKTNSEIASHRLKPKPCVKYIHVAVGDKQVRINNIDDWTWPPLDRGDILKEINSQLAGRAHTLYKCRVSFKDSEGFVNYCRYYDCRLNFGLVSDWCKDPSFLPRLHVGDRLEFHRTLPYAHWGIYVGDCGDDEDQVVHFAPANGKGKTFSKKKSSGSGSSAKNKPVFNVNHIEKVLGNDKVRVNNARDHKWPPFDRTLIWNEIDRLLKRQSDGHMPVYRVSSNNCEHFVNYCRYRKHHSDQVSRFSRIRYRLTKGQ